METVVRVILLLVGVLIMVGIFWDTLRGRRNRFTKQGRAGALSEPDTKEDPVFEDVVLIKRENPPAHKASKPEPQSDLFILYVMAKQVTGFSGKRFLEALEEVHLKYGDMQIFHRYENIDGTGQKMFSVASAIEPGTFELSNPDSCTTPGIILFFTANRVNHSITAFELMLRTAKLLATRLEGELKDESRRSFNAYTLEKYRERLRILKRA